MTKIIWIFSICIRIPMGYDLPWVPAAVYETVYRRVTTKWVCRIYRYR